MWTIVLALLLVLPTLVPSLALVATPARAASTMLPETAIAVFPDTAGRTVVLRQGFWPGRGSFGWDKIRNKHNITDKHLVRKIIQNPRGGTQQGTARVYRGFPTAFVAI